jgi:hypothetical protein
MKLKGSEYFADDLSGNWLGEVVLNEDPENLGRVKVKVFGKFDSLDVEHIPWAYQSVAITGGSNSGSGFYSVPKLGAIVNVTFDNKNIYHPLYTFHQTPSDELIEEIGEDYQNFHSLIYDTIIEGALKIFYSENAEKGFFINLKDTLINIKNDNEIVIQNPNGDIVSLKNDGTLDITTSAEVNVNTPTANINAQEVNLGENATDAVIKGDTFKAYFDTHQHIGNLGAPSGGVIVPLPANALSKVTKTK